MSHDPNMLKNITGGPTGKIESVSSRREKRIKLAETVHTVPSCVQFFENEVPKPFFKNT